MKYLLYVLLFLSPITYATPLIQSDVSRILLKNKTLSKLYIYNPSEYGGFYHLSLKDSNMDKFGKISFIDNSVNTNFIKFTPKNFYLAPKQKQLIRIKITNTNNIENELRSNLVVKLQNDYDITSQNHSKVFNLHENYLDDFSNYDTNLLYVIPIIYQKETNNNIIINNSTATITDDKLDISFDINREGNSSIYINIKIYVINDSNKTEILILSKNNKAIYFPSTTRNFNFSFNKKEIRFTPQTKFKIIISNTQETIIDTNIIH